jgi:hypothetical protein
MISLSAAACLLTLDAGRLVQAAVIGKSDQIAPFHLIAPFQEMNTPSELRLLQARIARISQHAAMEAPFREVFARIGQVTRSKIVFIVGSSVIFNEAVFQSAVDQLVPESANSYQVLPVPAVDSRDHLPVTEIISADFLLIADPLQKHLPHQDGLKRVYEMFQQNDRAALDFERLGKPIIFPGFAVSIYRRVKQSDEATVLATLNVLRAAVPRRGHLQPSWIEIGRPPGDNPIVNTDKILAPNRVKQGGWPARYVSYDTVAGKVQIRGIGRTTCPEGAVLILITAAPSDVKPITATHILHAGDSQPFLLTYAAAPAGAFHLILEISPLQADLPCDVILESLRMSSEGA